MPELTDELRPGLRLMHAWTTSLDSWLQSVRPSEARALLADRESLLQTIDRLAWAVLRHVANTRQTPDDYAEALKQEAPNWEDNATEDEIEQEERHPLTRAEIRAFDQMAGEAQTEASSE